MTYTAR